MERILARLRAAISMPTVLAMLAAFALLFLIRSDAGTGSQISRLEERIGSTLSQIEGAGKVEVVIRTKTAGVQTQSTAFGELGQAQEFPCGAIAIVEGTNDPYVRLQVTQALCALLGLQASQVNVLSASGG